MQEGLRTTTLVAFASMLIVASHAARPAEALAFECCTQMFQGGVASQETCRPCELLGPYLPPNHPANVPFPPPPLVMNSQCGDGICASEENPGCSSDCGGLGGVPIDPDLVDHVAPFRSDLAYQPGADAAGNLSEYEQFNSRAFPEVPLGAAPEVREAGTAEGRRWGQDRHEGAYGSPDFQQDAYDVGEALRPLMEPPDIPVRILPRGQGDLELVGFRAEDAARVQRDVAQNENTDPVHPVTGEMRLERTDLALSGVGLAFVFERVYGSRLDYDGPLGWGWTHTYDQQLVEVPSRCDTRTRTWTPGDGGAVKFVSDAGGP